MVTVTGMTGAGTVVAAIPAGVVADAIGLANFASTSTDNVVEFEGIAPTVTINQAAGQADPTNASPVSFTVEFSESVIGFDAADVSFAGSTVGGTLAANVIGTGTNYTVTVSGMFGGGTVVATIPAGAAIDAVGTPASRPRVPTTRSSTTSASCNRFGRANRDGGRVGNGHGHASSVTTAR